MQMHVTSFCSHDASILRHCYSAACLVWELGRWTLEQTLLLIINSTLPELNTTYLLVCVNALPVTSTLHGGTGWDLPSIAFNKKSEVSEFAAV
jgi:hypothetical protein